MDFFTKKNEFVNREQLNGYRQENANLSKNNNGINNTTDLYKKSYQEVYKNNDKIQNSKDTSWWFVSEDSPQMAAVKKAQADLISFYEGESISQDQKSFSDQKKKLEKLYSTVSEKCTNYLQNHQNPKSKSGKARKKMVERLLRDSKKEKMRFAITANEIYGTGKADCSWFNVLVAIRGFDLNQSDFEVSYTGGHESQVTVLTKDDKKIFFKAEEKNNSIEQEIKEKCLSDPSFKKDRKLLKHFLDFINNTDFDGIQIVGGIFNDLSAFTDETDGEPEEKVSKFLEKLKDGCEEEEINYPLRENEEETVGRFVYKYGKIISAAITRRRSCRQAKIAGGSVLSNRNVATSRIAKLVGCEKIICESANVILHYQENGQEKVVKGNAMAGSKGASINSILAETDNISFTPQVYRQMNMLQVFDIICGQVDRNGSNILYDYEIREIDGKKTAVISSIQAIDNDISFGELDYDEINKYADGLSKLKPLEFGKDGVNINGIDDEMCSRIMDISPEMLKSQLVDILSPAEIESAINRLKGIQNFLEKKGDQVVRRKEDFTKEQYEADKKNGYVDERRSYFGSYMRQYHMIQN